MIELTLIGHVGKDPEWIHPKSGKDSFVAFSIAVSSGSDENKKTTWVKISVKDKLAETVIAHVQSGARLWVRGTPYATAWEDRESRKLNADLNMWLNKMEFCSAKGEDKGQSSKKTNQTKTQEPEEDYSQLDSDDIPF